MPADLDGVGADDFAAEAFGNLKPDSCLANCSGSCYDDHLQRDTSTALSTFIDWQHYGAWYAARVKEVMKAGVPWLMTCAACSGTF